jgi:hypothetical protein
MRNVYGTLWYTLGPDGTRDPVDPRIEFGPDGIGHAAGNDDGEITA